MLISPLLAILYISHSPDLVDDDIKKFAKSPNVDSTINAELKKIEKEEGQPIDSLIKDSLFIKNKASKKAHESHPQVNIDLYPGDEDEFSRGEALFFRWLLFALLLAFIYSLPFKILFRRKRKNRKVPEKIVKFCRKTILHSPLITAGIISIPFFIQSFYLLDRIYFSSNELEPFIKDMYLKYWYVFILSSLLTIALVYTWQKHRMQLKYIQYIYEPEELKKRIFRFKGGKIKYRLVFSSFLTTLLPLLIVVAYLFMSLTSLSEINLYEPTSSEFKVIFGKYEAFFQEENMAEITKDLNLQYINVVDTILMFVGIGMGIFVTLIYLIFFVRWTNADIIKPVKELLKNMQKTTGGQLENYTIVRTNDEIGELSENYNIMTSKLHEYVSHIDKMNAELEQKVRERTAEISSQKEEIEAQRDEVESQRDEIERQRDYVIEQRDLIIEQKKAITDSIEYAGNIQSAILPPINYLESILDEHFIYFKPRDIVSGDFYWAYQITKANQNKTIIVAADSTGHGVPGAFMSMLGVALLNEIIIKKDITNPAAILDHLKENVVSSLHQTAEVGKPKDGIDIAVCAIDHNQMKLYYAGAYNSVYIIRKTEANEHDLSGLYKENGNVIIQEFGNSTLIELKADKNPIGISPKATKPYNLTTIDIKKGDSLYLFSDGMPDQFGGPRRMKFLYRRFKQMLVECSTENMNEQKKKINKTFNEWKAHEKQIDDILVIGIKLN